jgi:hypothetical protein
MTELRQRMLEELQRRKVVAAARIRDRRTCRLRFMVPLRRIPETALRATRSHRKVVLLNLSRFGVSALS